VNYSQDSAAGPSTKACEASRNFKLLQVKINGLILSFSLSLCTNILS